MVSRDVLERTARAVADDLEVVLREARLDAAPVHLAAYPHLDRRWWPQVTRALTDLGFAHLQDVDAAAVTARGAPPMMLRVMLDAAGTCTAGVYEVVPRWPGALTWLILRVLGKWRPAARVVELMSYGDDRVWSTSNQGDVNVFEAPPWVSRRVLPLGALPAAVLEAHRAHVGTAAVRAFSGFAALEAAREADRVRRNAWRADVGLLHSELDRMLAPHGAVGVALRPVLVAELAARGVRVSG